MKKHTNGAQFSVPSQQPKGFLDPVQMEALPQSAALHTNAALADPELKKEPCQNTETCLVLR
ncbi:hypothetical protein DC3_48790 [Deinococcus cellulosilyticus NBRC 106333 = KACC 11606]|uniref:Uncharacterized protein n=1 Tax=Deinococcus cellulosilyticus (strain DSM 18568 / NBRC 106333 / KACC 11606 / 5516J-15) TaxID=1223518 RepID=A0A511N8T8_DEIC1|nr:hypothetical protein DC3_48790 [Deinococcus cellulosilyticus NBRC 106333 = KACC 11606]